jgi:hypothetical protein
MSPTKVRLCGPCEQKVQADDRLARIKAETDHGAKDAAVEEFLKEVGFRS